MRLLLLRHGQTHSNVTGALDTAVPGADLTELGRAQATAAARALADAGVDALFVSGLARTDQTAAPLAATLELDPATVPGVREISAGDYEMATDRDSQMGYMLTVAEWLGGNLDARMPGGETGHEFLQRYDEGIAQVAASGSSYAVVVSHGAAIRVWAGIRTAPGAEARAEAHQPMYNTGGIELTGSPSEGWELARWMPHPIGGELLEDLTASDPTGRAD